MNWGKIYGYSYIYGRKLNTVKSADQYYSSYSYQSSSLISYLMYNDLHHDCKPYEKTREFSQSPCTVPSCRYFLTLIVLHPPGWDCVAVCIPWDKWSASERRPYMAAGGGTVYWKNWIRLRDAKKHTIKAFRWFKYPNEYQSFIFVTRVTRLIHNAGKYLLISIYPLPTYPTHNFTHENGGNLDTFPGWPKKLHLNRPARCAGQ